MPDGHGVAAAAKPVRSARDRAHRHWRRDCARATREALARARAPRPGRGSPRQRRAVHPTERSLPPGVGATPSRWSPLGPVLPRRVQRLILGWVLLVRNEIDRRTKALSFRAKVGGHLGGRFCRVRRGRRWQMGLWRCRIEETPEAWCPGAESVITSMAGFGPVSAASPEVGTGSPTAFR